MISKAKIKYIHTLQAKKGRNAEQCFVAEGPKVVGDLMETSSPKLVAATASWLAGHKDRLDSSTDTYEVTEEELQKVSFLQHPQQVLAVFPMYSNTEVSLPGSDELCLALDGVQDPGNLGTIIRIADWFGIKRIYCSRETADVYNPKVVQATMGSIARVRLVYTDLAPLLTQAQGKIPVYGTLLDGENLYEKPLSAGGIIVMGNEGNGISQEIRPLVTERLLIPSFPPNSPTAESLNVAIATAVTCAEFRRRISSLN